MARRKGIPKWFNCNRDGCDLKGNHIALMPNGGELFYCKEHMLEALTGGDYQPKRTPYPGTQVSKLQDYPLIEKPQHKPTTVATTNGSEKKDIIGLADDSEKGKTRLGGQRLKVFKLLCSDHMYYYGAQIAKLLGMPEQTVYSAIKRLIELNLIREELRSSHTVYVLTDEGKALMPVVLDPYEEVAATYDRLHCVYFKVPVVTQPTEFVGEWKKWPMKNWEVYSTKLTVEDGVDVEVRLQGEKSIGIRFGGIVCKDSDDTEDKAFQIAYAAIDQAKKRLKGLDVGTPVLVNLTSAHHTVTRDAFARRCKEKGLTIIGETHTVDASKGEGEIEFNRGKPIKNKECHKKYSKFVDRYLKGEIDPEATAEKVDSIDAALNKLAPAIDDLAENISAHVGLTKGVNNAAASLGLAAKSLLDASEAMKMAITDPRLTAQQWQNTYPKTIKGDYYGG